MSISTKLLSVSILLSFSTILTPPVKAAEQYNLAEQPHIYQQQYMPPAAYGHDRGGAVNTGIGGVTYSPLAATGVEQKDAPYKMYKNVDITVGAGVAVAPEYVGGKSEVSPVPIIDVTYGSWNLGLGGLHYGLIEDDNFGFGIAVGLDGGRKNKDLPKNKRGLGDVDSGAVLTLDAYYTMFEFLTASASVSNYVRDSGGMTGTVGLDGAIPLSETVTGNLGASTTWADEDYSKTLYGVNAKQATASGLKRFDAESGIQDITLNTGINYNFAQSWNYMAVGGVQFLQGAAADSPITDKTTSPFILTGVTYSF